MVTALQKSGSHFLKNKISQAIAAGLNDPQVKPKLLELGFEIVASTPEQFTAYQASEFARWKKVIVQGKIPLID